MSMTTYDTTQLNRHEEGTPAFARTLTRLAHDLQGAAKRELPALYSGESTGDDTVVGVKFFTPWTKWTWYATEYDPTEEICFGLIDGGDELELGYFSLTELAAIKGPFGLRIERDLHWTPKTLGEVRKAHEARRR